MAQSHSKQQHVVVVGGGMAGTAAAYRLGQLGYRVTVVERNSRLGGRICSIVKDQTSVEMGAGFVTDVYTNVFAFLKDTQLYAKLRRRSSRSGINVGGTSYLLTAGNLLIRGRPLTRRASLALLASFAKIVRSMRGFDVHRPWRVSGLDDLSVPQAVAGRYAEQLIDNFWQPVLGAYCYWSAKRTSAAALAWLMALLRGKTYMLDGGLQQIPEAAAKDAEVLLDTTVVRLSAQPGGGYRVTLMGHGRRRVIVADGVVCALPATEAVKLVPGLSRSGQRFLASVSYSATAVLARLYSQQPTPPNRAYGFPRSRDYVLGGLTITTESALTVVKSYASGLFGPELCRLPAAKVQHAILKATPDSAHYANLQAEYVQLWPQAIPELTVAHIANLRRLEAGKLKLDLRHLTFAGDYLIGPFIEGAFTSGAQAADRLHNQLSSR